MLHMTQIAVPGWARELTVEVDEDFGEEEYRRLSAHREQILDAVHEAVEQYVNDENYAYDDQFPQRNKMTGEYYISSEGYSIYTERTPPRRGERQWRFGPKQWRFSLSAHCLEKRWLDNQTDFDYLGLEVHFLWEPVEQRITFGGIDSSSI
jgi:hypothetical protein